MAYARTLPQWIPRATAGLCTVGITKGNEVFEQVIETIYDPRSPFTLEERKKQEAVKADLFRFTQELAYFVYKIDTYREAIREMGAKQKTSRETDALFNELEKLRRQLVITTGDNYVGSAEKMLREKLGDIYSTSASYYGAPSSSQMETVQTLKDEFAAHQALFNG
jgi:hypothetical protein